MARYPKRNQRPDIKNHNWRSGTLHLRGGARANLYWTPDPAHSRVLRLLHGGELIEFVPEVKYDHWVIVRVQHQIGWVDLNVVDITENRPAKPLREDPAVDPAMFLDEETMPTRSPEFDRRLQAVMAADDDKTPPSRDHLRTELRRSLDELDAGGSHDDDNQHVSVSMRDLKRLIRYVAGIKDVINNALGSEDGTD